MRTDIAIDKLISVAPIIENLTEKMSENPKIIQMLKSTENVSNREFVFKYIPVLLQEYKEEVFEILAIFNDKTVDEIKAQSLGETIKQIREIFSDKDFSSFFQPSEKIENATAGQFSI